MPSQPATPSTPLLSLGDIYYVLFRHKWKIVLCCVAGLGASYAYYRLNAPPFQSEAKLFVRYIETEHKTSLGPGSAMDTLAKTPDLRGETIMNSEMEILTSLDLARQVAEAVGAERILARNGGGGDLEQAAAEVKLGLFVDVLPRSSVFRIVFRYPDPAVVQPVLREVIDRYLRRHLEIHRAAGMMRDSLAQETDQLRSRLAQTEDELRIARNNVGVVSFEDTRKALTEQIAATRQQLFTAEAELAALASVQEAITPSQSAREAGPGKVAAADPIPTGIAEEYVSLSSRVARLLSMEQELSTQFTDENTRVKEIRAQISEVEGRRKQLAETYPGLRRSNASAAPANHGTGPVEVDAKISELTALRAKTKVLTSQLELLKSEAAKIDATEGAISELKRKKELEETNYRYYAATLEQSRINETLANGRVSNISEIQSPSPPARDWTKAYKTLAGLIGGGFGLGLAWAFFIELYADRSLRRPRDVEQLLGIPLFITIPRIGRNGRARWFRRHRKQPAPPPNLANGTPALNQLKPGREATSVAINNGEEIDRMAPFHETLRDRLIAYFESRNLTHKPKLVALTGLGRRTGVTTIAAGLARSLSETGEGNVLLVDMTAGHGSARSFTRGQATCGLDEMLDTREGAHVDEHLYVVVEQQNDLSHSLPLRFSKMVPRLKATDFDYIIFDMPAVSQISITPRLASFMDMVLLVVESEKTNRDIAQAAGHLLARSKAEVGVILNKTRAHVPAFLDQEFLNA